MPWLRRSDRLPALPAQVREGLALRRGERLLAHAQRLDGGWVIATSAALVLVDPVDGPLKGPGTPSERRWWHDVADATWDPDTSSFAIRWADGSPSSSLALSEPVANLPQVLRERVMSTFVLSQRVPVRGRRGVTVAVRRHAVDGTLFMQQVPDDGVNLTRAAVADQVAALTRDLAEQAGLPPDVRSAPETC
ncbi:hypothetical protein [Angustibacter sp. Root456]|uniref:hypothetical protein n=1 Tax=Angustibacter sp. Root456 TaxID=1736539 RepID=UPI0006F71F00|nr:hypothetical protein [Angustibacter sp. Root456]KQX69541.1 hypothetical protein ASD06_00220 [Angustibacter sp. Root456]